MTHGVLSAGSGRRAGVIALLLLPLLVTGCGAAKDVLASAAGATARCKDGTYTNHDVPAAGCQGRGGVDEYLNRPTTYKEPRLFAPEGRWEGTWTSDATPGLNGTFTLTVQADGTVEGAFQSGKVFGRVSGAVQVSDNPVELAPPATELVLQSASLANSDGMIVSRAYRIVLNRPTPDRLIGKLTRVMAEGPSTLSGFPDSFCTVEMTRQ